MDVKCSEWSYEQIMVRMWARYMWKGPWCLVKPWLQNHTHSTSWCLIALILHI